MPIGLVVLTNDAQDNGVAPADVCSDVVARVRAQIGAVASFKVATTVEALPKTRSGKTLRGIIQHIANGSAYTLPGTIEDVSPVEAVKVALKTVGYPPSEP